MLMVCLIAICCTGVLVGCTHVAAPQAPAEPVAPAVAMGPFEYDEAAIHATWTNRTHPDRCPVHDVPFLKDRVPLINGMSDEAQNMPPVSIEMRDFPFANRYYFNETGCILTGPLDRYVDYCPECRRVEAEWRKRNPAPPVPREPEPLDPGLFKKIGVG